MLVQGRIDELKNLFKLVQAHSWKKPTVFDWIRVFSVILKSFSYKYESYSELYKMIGK